MKETRFDIGGSDRAAMALGWFDGLHTGHMALIEETVRTARRSGLSAAVWTFEGSKNNIGGESGTASGALLSDEEKADILRSAGIDVIFSERFENVKDLTPEEFVRETVIKKCRCETALCGFNYRFGKGGAGDAETLSSLMKAEGKSAVVLPPVRSGGETVSSTLVRKFLSEGKPELANALLGRGFSLKSTIEHGRRIGHELGVPTINQSFPEGFIIPKFGVYITRVTVNGAVYDAVSDVGVHPTFKDGGNTVCESNLLSGDPGECYGAVAETKFLLYIRPEVRFPSPELLKAEISEDIKKARAYFARESGRKSD